VVSCQSPVTFAALCQRRSLRSGREAGSDVREVVDHWELAWRGVLEK